MATSTNVTASLEPNNEPEPTAAESEMTEVIAKDRPTIDAAVKSFISMVCASSMTASSTNMAHDRVMMGIIPALSTTSLSVDKDDSNPKSSTDANIIKGIPTKSISTQHQVLVLGRCILRAVNSYTFPVHDTMAYSLAENCTEKRKELLELSVVARLWNALIQSEQKPSRFLGRRALKLAWKNLNVNASFHSIENEEGESTDNNIGATVANTQQQQTDIDVRERQMECLRRFEDLLFESTKPLPSNMNTDDDSALLWTPDGGAAELAKRRHRRLDAAKDRGPVTPS